MRALCLACAALAACTPYPPAGTGGLAERAALPAEAGARPDATLAAATAARLACLDARYETLAAAGHADRHPALAAQARDARRDALRWTAAGLVRDGALAADDYARRIEALAAPARAGAAAC